MTVHKAACLALVILAAGPTGGIAQPAPSAIVGAWTLVKSDQYGSNPLGQIMFDGNGHFTVIQLRSDLPKYAANARTQGTPAEYKATVEGSIAFFGTYSVRGTDINMHILGSTFPNWIGMDQKRINLSVTGDELKFVQPTPSGGGYAETLIWKRAPTAATN